jgi:hypothetical protein
MAQNDKAKQLIQKKMNQFVNGSSSNLTNLAFLRIEIKP